MGVDQGIVKKAGAWYTYEGEQLGQGKENARTFLLDNADLTDEIERRLKAELGIGVKAEEVPEVKEAKAPKVVEPNPIDA
jgi:recombination protein RecA